MKYNSLTDLWNHVVSGTSEFQKFERDADSDNERRFLQALHSQDALDFIANKLSREFRPVTVASAFIDNKPRFTWSTGSGEIADILILINRTDHKHDPIVGCLVQTKVTDSHDMLDTDDSTINQLTLYPTWPNIEFKSGADQESLKSAGRDVSYDLKNDVLEWPFPFLKICTISPSDKKMKTPKWVFRSQDETDHEPFYVNGKFPPSAGNPGITFTEWLQRSGGFNRTNSDFEVIIGENNNSNFADFVSSLLVVLRDRQKDKKIGYSLGKLLNESLSSVIFDKLGTSIKTFKKFDYDYLQHFKKNTFDKISVPSEVPEDDQSNKPFLVLYIEYGPEGETKSEKKPVNQYPGLNLL